ncbi:MAG: AAA family ATPase [Actinobacteria bacterium]|nr:AAA family ATPase [Actinomycetota bacterium]
MTWEGIGTDAAAVREALARARHGLVDREIVAEVTTLCVVAGEHLLVVGPPGTAKSEAVRRVAHQIGGRYFEYLLGRFTEPNEIFGPVDLQRLRDGVVEFETRNMLPEADVAFIDEVFLGSTAILNTLLGILNERLFRRGSTALLCPLRVCVGATNSLPEDHTLLAFADRFLARIFVEPVSDTRIEELLETGWRAADPKAEDGRLLSALDRLSVARRNCDLAPVRPILARAVRRLRAAGIAISDRRAVRTQSLVAAAAVLDGRSTAATQDLWVLPLVAPTADTQQLARDTLADLIETSRNASLLHSAAELSAGLLAHADRLVTATTELLADLPKTPLTLDDRLRVEAALREMDATIPAQVLANGLGDLRLRLVNALEP